MAATVTIAIDGGALLVEDGVLHLGELAPVAFSGYEPTDGNTIRVTLFERDGKTPLADNHEDAGVLDLRGEKLRRAFRARRGNMVFYAVATEFTSGGESTGEVLATGQVPVEWSPLVFDAETGEPASLKGPPGRDGQDLLWDRMPSRAQQQVILEVVHELLVRITRNPEYVELLRGEKGETGATGATGAQGIQGIPGPRGEKGEPCDGEILETKADLVDGVVPNSQLPLYVNAANYDSSAKKIILLCDSTKVDEIDAKAFVKDGIVDSVVISDGNLVITFNTDAGKDPISIPLADIFNPSNYYDKTATDAKFSEYSQNFAPEFDAQSWSRYELCMYDNVMYMCKSSYTATEESEKPDVDTTHWATIDAAQAFMPAFGTARAENLNVLNTLIFSSSLRMERDSPGVFVFYGDNLAHDVYLNIARAVADATVAFLSDIGIPAFSTTATYAVGAKVVYDNALWNCTTAVSTAGAWTGTTNWAKVCDLSADATPTANSKALMTSGDIKTALDLKADAAALAGALAGKLSKAEAEAGFTEWKLSGLPSGATNVMGPMWETSAPGWEVSFELGEDIYDGVVESTMDATSISVVCVDIGISMASYTVTATRTRLPTMADLDGKASTADATLTPIYSATPTYSNWTILRDGVDVTSQVGQPSSGPLDDPDNVLWGVSECIISTDTPDGSGIVAPPDVATLSWSVYNMQDPSWDGMSEPPRVPYTATRVRTDIIGYVLGNQASKPLQPQLSAQQLTNIAAVPDKADASALRYSLNAVTIDYETVVDTDDAATVTNVLDSASNSATLVGSVTTATVYLPAATAGKMRDFFVMLEIEASAAPTLSFFDPATVMDVDIAFGEEALADIDTGYNLVLFTEIAANKFLVSVKHEDYAS